jgi:serine protease Do
MTLALLGAACVLIAPRASARATPQGPDLAALSAALEALTRQVAPAVVQIHVSGYSVGRGGGQPLSREQGSGSGAIVDPDGYVVTNAHVVAGARRIQVLLADPGAAGAPGRSVLPPPGRLAGAQLVGLDRETDLAVLKIPGTDHPHLTWGDSEELRPGQPVLAFGSPLGLENTVTFGVVSAVARQLEPEAPMIYVQTDASINPGNSGGPLVDLAGRLVGINTFILSQSGGNEGLGFAAPGNIVRSVFEQIRATGRVRRGAIGVYAQTITPQMAAALGLARTWGVVLSDVYPGSPAEAAGLRAGDLVLALDGKVMENSRQLQVNLYSRRAGDQVMLALMRGERSFTAQVAVAEQPDSLGSLLERVTPEQNLVARLGILALDLSPELLAMMPAVREPSGVVVAAVSGAVESAADGLRPGDVIHAIDGQRIGDVAALRTRLSALPAYATVVLHVERQGRWRFVTVDVE